MTGHGLSKGYIISLIWNLLLLCTVSARIFGKPCECPHSKEGALFTVHRHPTSEGSEVAKLVGEVAGQVTSKAVLSLLIGNAGHQPVLKCGQEELNKMERDFKKCTRRVQYQVKCFNKRPEEHCVWMKAFVENCTKGILGDCLSPSVTSFLASRQQAALFAKSRNCSDPKDDFLRPTPRVVDAETPRATIRHPVLTSSKKAFNRAILLRRALLHPHF